ncbi:MAG TPA: DUF6164 family protein [Xanthomonadaceae bacterium]|nr:DUF6164 family protein [Xanthomonadaceae bacterium]
MAGAVAGVGALIFSPKTHDLPGRTAHVTANGRTCPSEADHRQGTNRTIPDTASTAIMGAMPKLLLNLRHVDDDEAEEVRALMRDAGIEVYETPASAFGISVGGIWLRHDEDHPRARALMDEYQAARRDRVRREFAQARREGRVPGVLDVVRANPLQALLVVVGIAIALGMVALPVLLILR